MIYLLFFIIQAISLFFLSRITTNEIFYFLRLFIKDEKVNFTIVSILFFPGTIVHESAHFIAVMLLYMKVRDVKFFPEFEKNEIKLGHVLYEKKDFVRGILVGVAPFFAGMFVFWLLAFFHLFPNANIGLTVLFAYGIFAISSTMFSSKQDLVDIIYLLPLTVFIVGIVYIFNIRIDLLLKNPSISDTIFSFIKTIDIYFFFSIIINVVIIGVLKFLRNRVK